MPAPSRSLTRALAVLLLAWGAGWLLPAAALAAAWRGWLPGVAVSVIAPGHGASPVYALVDLALLLGVPLLGWLLGVRAVLRRQGGGAAWAACGGTCLAVGLAAAWGYGGGEAGLLATLLGLSLLAPATAVLTRHAHAR